MLNIYIYVQYIGYALGMCSTFLHFLGGESWTRLNVSNYFIASAYTLCCTSKCDRALSPGVAGLERTAGIREDTAEGLNAQQKREDPTQTDKLT